MSKEKHAVKYLEERIRRYYKSLSLISQLQSKLNLYLKNKESIQLDMERNNSPEEISAPTFEGLQQELSTVELKIIDTKTLIREQEQGIIDMYLVLEQLTEENRRFIELRYKGKYSFPALGIQLSMSTATAARRKVQILNVIASMLH